MKRLVLLLVTLSLSIISFAQEKAYWQDIAYKNPAAIGENSDWAYAGYNFSNFDEIISGYIGGFDYELSPKVGSIGLFYAREEFGIQVTSTFDLSYAYDISIQKNQYLSFGFSSGLFREKLNVVNLFTDGVNDPLFSSDDRMDFLKTSFGGIFSSSKFKIGLSYTHYFHLEGEFGNRNSFSSLELKKPGYITTIGSYSITVQDILRIEPHAMFDFYEEKTDKFLGIMFKFKNLIWADYSNYNFNELHSASLGIDINRFRIGYSCDFTEKVSRKRLNIHEFLLAVRIR